MDFVTRNTPQWLSRLLQSALKPSIVDIVTLQQQDFTKLYSSCVKTACLPGMFCMSGPTSATDMCDCSYNIPAVDIPSIDIPAITPTPSFDLSFWIICFWVTLALGLVLSEMCLQAVKSSQRDTTAPSQAKTIASLRAKIDRLVLDQNADAKVNKDLRDDLHHTKSTLAKRQSDLRECKSELEGCKSDLEECTSELEECKSNLEDCKSNLEDCKSERRQKTDRLLKVREKDIETLRSQIKGKDTNVKEMQEDHDTKLQGKMARIKTLEDEKIESDKNVKNQDKEIRRLNASVEKLEADLAAANKTIETTSTEPTELPALNKAQAEDLEAKDVRISELQEEVKKIKRAHDEMSQQLHKAQSELKNPQTCRHRAMCKVVCKKCDADSIDRLESDLEQVSNQLVEAQKEWRRQAEEIVDKEMEIKKLTDAAKKQDADFKNLQKACNDFVQTERGAWQSQVNEKQAALDTERLKTAGIPQLQQEIDQLSKEKKNLEAKLDEVQSTMDLPPDECRHKLGCLVVCSEDFSTAELLEDLQEAFDIYKKTNVEKIKKLQDTIAALKKPDSKPAGLE